MKCSEAEALVSAYADNELSKDENQKIKEHLASCEACRLLIEFELSTKRVISSMAILKAPIGLKTKILADISGESISKEKRIFFPWTLFRQNAAFATAAGILIFVGVLFAVIHLYGGNRISPLIGSVYAYHANGNIPEDVTGTSEEIEKALQKSLAMDIPIPNLEGIDLALVGATYLPKISEKPCAALRYKGKNGDAISHIVICCTQVPIHNLEKIDGKPEYRCASKDGLNMIFWQCETTKTTRCIAANFSMEKLIAVADEFRIKATEEYNRNHLNKD